MCRLKSTRLCTRKPLQATSPESCKVPAKELLSWRNRFKDSLNKTPRNQAQQNLRECRFRRGPRGSRCVRG